MPLVFYPDGQKLAVKDIDPSFAAMIVKARETNPNAYMRWNKMLDAELLDLYRRGCTVYDLMTQFGRSRSAVISRLKRLTSGLS